MSGKQHSQGDAPTINDTATQGDNLTATQNGMPATTQGDTPTVGDTATQGDTPAVGVTTQRDIPAVGVTTQRDIPLETPIFLGSTTLTTPSGTRSAVFGGRFNYRVPVFAAVALIAGITVSAAFSANKTAVLVCYIVFGLLAAAGIALVFVKKPPLYFWLTLFLLIGFSFYNISYSYHSTGNYTTEDAVITGVITRENKKYYDYNVYLLEDLTIDAAKAPANAYLYTKDNYLVGAVVSAQGTLNTFDWNPFDYFSVSYYNSKVKHTMIADNVDCLSIQRLTLPKRVRNKIKTGYEKLLSEDSAGIALSLVLGDKSLLPNDINYYFRASGLSHIFAVSGLHIGFLAVTIIFICGAAKLSKRIAFGIAFVTMLCYGAVTGFPPSIVRATIMTGVGFLGFLSFNRPDPLNSLALSATMILLASPMSLFDLGFQLSFTAVLGIICFYQPIKNAIKLGKNKLLRFVGDSFALSLSANTLVFAICVNAFQVFGIYFCLANLIVIPLVGILYACIMLATMLYLIVPPSGILLAAFDYPLLSLRYISEFFATLPGAMAQTHNIGILSLIYILSMLYMSRFVMVDDKIKYKNLIWIIAFSLFYAIIFL